MANKEMRVTISVTITTDEGAYTVQEHLNAPSDAVREQIVENGVGVARRVLWNAYDGAAKIQRGS